MLDQEATILTKCPISGVQIQINVDANGPEPEASGLVHFAVPASKWWEDIAFT